MGQIHFDNATFSRQISAWTRPRIFTLCSSFKRHPNAEPCTTKLSEHSTCLHHINHVWHYVLLSRCIQTQKPWTTKLSEHSTCLHPINHVFGRYLTCNICGSGRGPFRTSSVYRFTSFTLVSIGSMGEECQVLRAKNGACGPGQHH